MQRPIDGEAINEELQYLVTLWAFLRPALLSSNLQQDKMFR